MQWALTKAGSYSSLILVSGFCVFIIISGCLSMTLDDIEECNNMEGTGRNICLQNYYLSRYRETDDPSDAIICNTFIANNNSNDGYKCWYVFAIEAARKEESTQARNFCEQISNPFAESIIDDPVLIRNQCYTDIAIILKNPTLCNHIDDDNLNYYDVLKVFNRSQLQEICKERVNQTINERAPFS